MNDVWRRIENEEDGGGGRRKKWMIKGDGKQPGEGEKGIKTGRGRGVDGKGHLGEWKGWDD
jgi:hypothetical protein